MFHYSVRSVFIFGLTGVAAIGVLPAFALDHQPAMVSLQVKLVELDRDYIRDLPIGRNFEQIMGLTPAVGGIADRPVDLVPQGVSSGLSAGESSIDDVLSALERDQRGNLLGSGGAEFDGATGGVVNVITRRSVVSAPTLDGTGIDDFDVGIDFTFTPRVTGQGTIALDLKLTGDYIEYDGNLPTLDSLKVDTSLLLRDGQTLAIGGILDDGARDAAGRLPILGDVPILGNIFRSDRFRRGETNLFFFITPTIVGDGQGTSEPAGPAPVIVEVRFLELQDDFFERIGIDFDFDVADDFAPAVAGIADRPADLVPGDVSLGLGLDDLELSTLIRALERNGVGVPRGSAVTEYDGATGVPLDTIIRRADITVPSADGAQSFQFNNGLDLRVTPRVTDEGTIDVNLTLNGDYVEYDGNIPTLDSLRVNTSLMVRDGQTVVIGGLFDQGARDAASRVPVLQDIPMIGSLFRSRQFQRGDTDLFLFVTPTLYDPDGTPRSNGEPAADTSAAASGMARDDSSGISVSAGVGYGYQGMPSFDWLRTETGFMGNIVERPFVSEDSDFSGAEFRLGLEAGLPFSIWGQGKSKLGLQFSYFDADTESFTNQIDANGQGLGIEDPLGLGFFVNPGFGDLFDVRFQAQYEAFDTKLMVYEELDLGVMGNKKLDVGAGLNLRYSDFDASLSAVTNGNTLNIQRTDQVETFFVAPTVEAQVSHDYGNGFSTFAGINLAAGLGFADGWSGVQVGVNNNENDPSETGFVYKAGLSAGVTLDLNPIVLDLRAEADYGNFQAVVEYQPFDQATVEFEDDFGAFIGVTAKIRF